MKRKLSLLLLLVATSFSGISAEVQQRYTEFLCGDFWSHWYASLGLGAEFHIQQDESKGATFDKLKTAPTFNVSLGKWINPYFGVRAQYYFSRVKGSTDHPNRYVNEGSRDFTGNLSVLHADAMFNFNSIVAGYKADRFYQLYPYFGLAGGFFYPKNDKNEREVMLKLGLVNDFRLSDKFSAFIEASYLHNNTVIYGMPKGSPRLYPINVSVGATYYFGGRSFVSTDDIYDEAYNAMEPLKRRNKQLVAANNSLNEENGLLSNNIDSLEAKVARANAMIASMEKSEKLIPIPAFFDINSSRITKRHIGTFKFAAEKIKSDTSKNYVVYGYADSATGNDKINDRLAQDRADAIVNVLVEKYGVDPSQVKAVGKGGVDDVFDDMTLNRCVILTNEE